LAGQLSLAFQVGTKPAIKERIMETTENTPQTTNQSPRPVLDAHHERVILLFGKKKVSHQLKVDPYTGEVLEVPAFLLR